MSTNKDICIHGIQMMPTHLTYDFISGIKQKLFLFDTVGVPDVTGLLNILYNHNREAYKEFYTLLDTQLIFDSHSTNAHELKFTPDGQMYSAPRKGMIIPIEFILANISLMEDYNEMMRISTDSLTSNEIRNEIDARVQSILWNGLKHLSTSDEYVPVLSLSNLPNFNKPKIEVYNVIFDNVPIPHPNTPIGHILEFRANSDNKGRLLSFRTLVNKMSKGNYTELEIQQEINELIYVYSENLRKQKVKMLFGILEAAFAISFSKEYLLSKILKSLIKFRSSSLNTAPSETSSSGREISYLYNIQKMFNPS